MKKFIASALSVFVILAIFIFSTQLIITKNANFESVCAKNSSESCDAVIAISGGQTLTRAQKAVEIFENGFAKKIIFSGANSDPKIASDAAQMSAQAQKLGVSKSDILLEENSKNTSGNAKFTAKIIKENGFKRVILTTSPYHQTRATLEFEKALEGSGVQVLVAPAENDSDWSDFWWLSARGWTLAMTELGGIIKFYLGA